MIIQNIPTTYSFSFAGPTVDSEEKEIMNRLLSYGVTPTGNKSTDRATLRRIELEKAKDDNIVSNKYLTVSVQEQERIQENKKLKRKENGPTEKKELEKLKSQKLGETYLGQQIYLAIKMKKDSSGPSV